MPADWLRRILSTVQPLAYAQASGKLSRRVLVEIADILENVAHEMREKAG